MPDRSGRPRRQTSEPDYSIRAVERAVAVLNSFSVESPELSLKEITDCTGLAKPTVFRLLATLEPHRYVSLDTTTGRYRLGSRVLELGGVALSSMELRKVARPHLNRLQRETGETVLLGALMDGQLVFLDKRDSAGPIRVAVEVGWRRSPHFGMLGMVLLAFRDPPEIDRILENTPLTTYTRFSVTDGEAFRARLAQIRQQDYVVEHNEAIEGFAGVAAPVRDRRGGVVAALGVALPLSERSEEVIPSIVTAVTAGARNISEGLGFRTAPA